MNVCQKQRSVRFWRWFCVTLGVLTAATSCTAKQQPVEMKTLPPTTPTFTAGIKTPLPPTAVDLLPNPTPFELSDNAVRKAMVQWITAYNERNEQLFLAYLADDRDLIYGDCDYVARENHVFHDRNAVRDWIRQRWAEDDQFQLRGIDFMRGSGVPTSGERDPFAEVITGVGLDVHRINRHLPKGTDIGFKIRFTPGHGIIWVAAMEGNVRCVAGKF